LCNAAAYIHTQTALLLGRILDDLATITPEEVLSGLLGLGGWESSLLYQTITALEVTGGVNVLTEWEAVRDEVICALKNQNLERLAVIPFLESLPLSPVTHQAVMNAWNATLENGQWATWIAVGALIDTSCPDCGTNDVWEQVFDFTTGAYSFQTRLPNGSVRTSQGWVSSGANWGGYQEAGCKRALTIPIGTTISEIVVDWHSVTPKGMWTWRVGYGSLYMDLPNGTGDLSATWAIGPNSDSAELYVLLHFVIAEPVNNRQVRRVIVRGTGLNPF
jgi:hypothetical protein